ncbi:MAG: hypothetical protein CM15mP128_5360 [Methanobacteriota archaeon]|nr:MAG: hypothetical protein CM15mP128_5360 [Euryarchaeota archaeon]
MRDRRKLFTFDTLVVGRTPPLGYLQKAAYACAAKGCDFVKEIEQRLARQRESPGPCPKCAERFLSGMEPDEREVAARFLPRSSYYLVNEDLRYIDVQYLADGRPSGRRWTLVVGSARMDGGCG